MKPVILCVDDETIVLRSLEVELSEYFGNEYFLEFAETGEEALEIVEELLENDTEIPVVIADYVMPRIKGDRLLAMIHEKTPATKTILLTGQANLHGITNAINHADLYRYISKPWEKKDLVLTIKEAGKVYEQDKILKKQNKELRELNGHLEEKVTERTHELQQQKEEVTSALEQLKQTQAQLIQSERMASLWQLTAGVAHELNNPLNFVLTGTEALIAGMGGLRGLLSKYAELDEGKVNDMELFIENIQQCKEDIAYKDTLEELSIMLRTIRTGAKRSAEIIKGLRMFSGLGKKDASYIDLNVNMDLTLLVLESYYQDRIEIKKQYGKLPLIECFSGQISQLLLNVITNSIQAIQENGVIDITTAHVIKEGKHFIIITVQDTGIGIKEELLDRIFEPFFTTKEVGAGKGLGLAIAYGIVERHRGKIEIVSRLNKGTKVTITLPTQLPDERLSLD